MSFRWTRTNAALDEFFELLRCGFCARTLQHPIKLMMCGHTFCRACCTWNKYVCMECKIPMRPNEMQPHHLLSQLISYCNIIKQAIGEMSVEAAQENEEPLKTESATSCAPSTSDVIKKTNPPQETTAYKELRQIFGRLETNDVDLETPGYRDPTQSCVGLQATESDSETPGYRDTSQTCDKLEVNDTTLETPGYRDPTQIPQRKDKSNFDKRLSKKLVSQENAQENRKIDAMDVEEKDDRVESDVLVAESEATKETPINADGKSKIAVPEIMETEEIQDTVSVDVQTTETISSNMDFHEKADNIETENLFDNGPSTSTKKSRRISVDTCRKKLRSNPSDSMDEIAHDRDSRTPKARKRRKVTDAIKKTASPGRPPRKSLASNKNGTQSPRKIAESKVSLKRLTEMNKLAVPKIMPKDPNKRNGLGESKLHEACTKGRETFVKMLLEAGADPNSKDNAGWTPLQEAVDFGYLNICKMLLEAGASPNIPGRENKTALHNAVLNNKYEETVLLLRFKANRNVFDNNGQRPIDYASTDAMRTLLTDTTDIEPFATDEVPRLNNTLDQSITTPNAKFVVLPSNLTSGNKKLLVKIAPKLHVSIAPMFKSEVTHVVVEANARNVIMLTHDVMLAILAGKWILNSQWISIVADAENASDIDLKLFEVRGVPYLGTPERCRINEEERKPRLFNNCIFYFTIGMGSSWTYGNCELTKHDLTSLVDAGQGEVLNREPDPEFCKDVRRIPFHVAHQPQHSLRNCSHYIVYMPGKDDPRVKYNMPHIKALPLAWFLECIEKFELVDPLLMGIA